MEINFQHETHPLHRNRAVLSVLKSWGYPLPCIRKALVALNGLSNHTIAKGEVSLATMSKTLLRPHSVNARAKALLAEALGLTETELFEEAACLTKSKKSNCPGGLPFPR